VEADPAEEGQPMEGEGGPAGARRGRTADGQRVGVGPARSSHRFGCRPERARAWKEICVVLSLSHAT
jgi:hypothetical protein